MIRSTLASASDAERSVIAAELADVRSTVRAEMVGIVASEFDGVHNIHRAVEVGSVDEVIAPQDLRPRIVAALDLG